MAEAGRPHRRIVFGVPASSDRRAAATGAPQRHPTRVSGLAPGAFVIQAPALAQLLAQALPLLGAQALPSPLAGRVRICAILIRLRGIRLRGMRLRGMRSCGIRLRWIRLTRVRSRRVARHAVAAPLVRRSLRIRRVVPAHALLARLSTDLVAEPLALETFGRSVFRSCPGRHRHQADDDRHAQTDRCQHAAHSARREPSATRRGGRPGARGQRPGARKGAFDTGRIGWQDREARTVLVHSRHSRQAARASPCDEGKACNKG